MAASDAVRDGLSGDRHRAGGGRTKRRAWVAVAVVAAPLAWVAGASAQSASIVVPLESVVTGPSGSVVTLAVVDSDASQVGLQCRAVYEADNNGSVHPGTDLLVSSGGRTIVLADIEAAAGAVTTGSGDLVLGPTITIAVRLGPDQIASMGAALSLTCALPATTSTAAPTTLPTTSTLPDVTVATDLPPVPTTAAPVTTASVGDQQVATTSTLAPGTTTAATMSAGGPTTSRPATGAGQLPATGSNTGLVALLAGVVLVTGLLVRRATPRHH